MPIDLQNVLTLVALQFLAFGWRVVRELEGKDAKRYPWVPVPDNVNLASMVAVVYWGALVPLMSPAIGSYTLPPLGRAIFAAAMVLLVAHPIVVASHYRLWDGGGRGINLREAEEHPYCTRQEALLQLIALATAVTAALMVLRGNG